MLDRLKPMFHVGTGLRGGLIFCLKTILALNHCLNHFDSAFKQLFAFQFIFSFCDRCDSLTALR